MTPTEQELYQKIFDFQLDDPNAVFPFSYKLSWQYRWTYIYTLRVIQEYKKLIFLAMVADHIVSPSAPVDRVWHFHLIYTHSYWDELCGKILKKPLHHSPGLGGKEDGIKFEYLYKRTLETYHNYFGTPPDDIWHNPRRRTEFMSFQWIDRQQYLIVPNPLYWLQRK